MTDTRQLGPAGRLLFWILGSTLFFVIALLPYMILMDYTLPLDYPLRAPVLPWVVIVFALLWLATTYGQMKTSASSKVKTPSTPMLGTGSGPAHTAVRVVFIMLQILILPLVVLAIIRALAG